MDFGSVPDNNLKASFMIFFYSSAFYTLCIFHSTVDLTCKCFSKSVVQKKMKKKNTEKIKTQCWLYVIRILKKNRGYKKFMFVSCSSILDTRLEL